MICKNCWEECVEHTDPLTGHGLGSYYHVKGFYYTGTRCYNGEHCEPMEWPKWMTSNVKTAILAACICGIIIWLGSQV